MFITGFRDDNVACKMLCVLKDKNTTDEELVEKFNEVVYAENERQTKPYPVGKTKVNKVINAATPTHVMSSDVETKAKGKSKQKPEESMQAKLLAVVETMQAELVKLPEIVNPEDNDKSRGARPRSNFGSNRGSNASQ